MKKISLGIALFLFTSFAAAEVTVANAWARATVPAQKTTGAFMQLSSNSNLRLVEATSPIAGAVELHGTQNTGNVSQMRPVDALDLSAGKPVELKPGGYHFMLIDLKQQIQAGGQVPLTLIFVDARGQRTIVNVAVPVQPINSIGVSAAHTH